MAGKTLLRRVTVAETFLMKSRITRLRHALRKKDKWVIAHEPEGPGSLYYGPDGKLTRWSHAAEFDTQGAALTFAHRRGIKVGQATVQIVVKRHTPVS